MVNFYSLAKDGNTALSPHFKCKEFKCQDGSDLIIVDPELLRILEAVRTHFNAPVTINSGYRTPQHNYVVGGVNSSYHLYGMAADIVVSGVKPQTVYNYINSMMHDGGIGLYSWGVHVDTRPIKSRWNE